MPRRRIESVGTRNRARRGSPTTPGTRSSALGRASRTQLWRRAARARTQSPASYGSHSFLMADSSRTLVAAPLFVTEHGGATMNAVTIEATDRVNLRGCVYEPPGEPVYQLLVLPGIGVPQRVFRHLATWFAGNGVRVVTID